MHRLKDKAKGTYGDKNSKLFLYMCEYKKHYRLVVIITTSNIKISINVEYWGWGFSPAAHVPAGQAWGTKKKKSGNAILML